MEEYEERIKGIILALAAQMDKNRRSLEARIAALEEAGRRVCARPGCGTPLTGRSDQKVCSLACKRALYYARKAATGPAAVGTTGPEEEDLVFRQMDIHRWETNGGTVSE